MSVLHIIVWTDRYFFYRARYVEPVPVEFRPEDFDLTATTPIGAGRTAHEALTDLMKATTKKDIERLIPEAEGRNPA